MSAPQMPRVVVKVEQHCNAVWDVPQDCGKPYYLQNYLIFFGAISAKYPHMRLIANCDMGQDAPTGGVLVAG